MSSVDNNCEFLTAAKQVVSSEIAAGFAFSCRGLSTLYLKMIKTIRGLVGLLFSS